MSGTVLPATDAGTSNQKAIVLGLLVGVLVVGIDSTIVATILPHVLGEFGDLPLAPWVFAAYMLMQITTAPIWGKLSDRLGRKRVFLFGLFVFLLGSELIAFSGSFAGLIVFRAMQGVGAGAILPSALATLFLAFPPELRPRLQGGFSAAYGVSNILGPLLGALLAERVGWRYAFHINLLFVSVSAYLIIRYFRDAPVQAVSARLDWAGAFTLVSMIALISLAAMRLGGAEEMSSVSVRPSLLAGLALIAAVAFVLVEARAADPIIPAYFMRHKTLAVLGNLVTGSVMYSFIFFLPLFVRAVLHGSPGVALLPLTVSLVFGSVLGGRAVARYGTRTAAIIAAAFVVAGAAGSTKLHSGSSVSALLLIGPSVGAGLGGLLVTMVVTMQAQTPKAHLGVSSSLSQFMRNLGGLLGVNILSAVQSAVLRHQLPSTLRAGLAETEGVKQLTERLFSPESSGAAGAATIAEAYTRASVVVFWACTALGVIALFIASYLPSARFDQEGG